MVVRDTNTNTTRTIPNKERAHQITALATHFSDGQSRIAMAESDYTDPSELYFSIYEVNDQCEFRCVAERVKVELPEEDMVSPRPSDLEHILKGRDQAYQARAHQDFNSAAAGSSPQNIGHTNTGMGSVNSGKDKTQILLPFVSQICFSNNFQYVAVLVSGSVNRVAVYETKSGMIKLVASKNFKLTVYQDEVVSPMANGEQSRCTDKSKVAITTFFQQAVTQISFNPRHYLSLYMTGPVGRLDYCKIERNELVYQHDMKIVEMKEFVGEYANITAHSWSQDGDYFGVCTDDGQVCVYKLGFDIVFFEKFRLPRGPDEHLASEFNESQDSHLINFVGLKLHEHGLVVATSSGHFSFFELTKEGDSDSFHRIRDWQYEVEAGDPENDELVQGLQVLEQNGQRVMAVQLTNRNVMLIDMWNEVYLQDKRDDIAMKLQEHESIVNSAEEKARMDKIVELTLKNKARQAVAKERQKITAINFRLLANGFHSGEISELHTCLQRPIFLTLS